MSYFHILLPELRNFIFVLGLVLTLSFAQVFYLSLTCLEPLLHLAELACLGPQLVHTFVFFDQLCPHTSELLRGQLGTALNQAEFVLEDPHF